MRRLGVVLAVAAGSLIAVPSASARDVVVNSFDDTPIVAHFFPAAGLQAHQRAPTIMIGPGWGGSGETDENGGSVGDFRNAGYNVLTWDPRGFGGSGGTVEIDSPDFEARDCSALIDYISKQPEARLDRKGDPRLGMSGGSYGGGIQFITAATDKRVDVIEPTISWHNLPTSLYPRGIIKAGWDLALIGLGIPTSTLLGVFSPAGIQLGNQSPQFYQATVQGLASGRMPQDSGGWFKRHGPDYLLHRIHIPTLIAQGTVDTLFNLDQADRNYRALRHNHIPLKMMWFCGGHGVCNVTGDGGSALADSARVQKRRLAWFARYLRGNRRAKVGPAFEWIDESGEWHTSTRYKLRGAGHLTGKGSGTVPLVPGINPTSGVLIFASPDPLATVTLPIETPAKSVNVVGQPRLQMTYKATGVPNPLGGRTAIFAQLVDLQRNLVVNNDATPIPVKLDGQRHSISRRLVRMASASTSAGYELQLINQSDLYDAQRSTGVVSVSQAKVSLPVRKPFH
jgi:ABC-2 type transport system ATP-binding protein